MNSNEIVLKSGKKITRIPVDAIVQITGLGNYSQFILRDGRRIISAYTMKVYQDMLPDYFLRIHRASLVNSHCITGWSGQHGLLLIDGSRVEIARRKAETFRAQYAALKLSSLADGVPFL
jgi:DNA-binding LytR/AlgR family response regulator